VRPHSGERGQPAPRMWGRARLLFTRKTLQLDLIGCGLSRIPAGTPARVARANGLPEPTATYLVAIAAPSAGGPGAAARDWAGNGRCLARRATRRRHASHAPPPGALSIAEHPLNAARRRSNDLIAGDRLAAALGPRPTCCGRWEPPFTPSHRHQSRCLLVFLLLTQAEGVERTGMQLLQPAAHLVVTAAARLLTTSSLHIERSVVNSGHFLDYSS